MGPDKASFWIIVFLFAAWLTCASIGTVVFIRRLRSWLRRAEEEQRTLHARLAALGEAIGRLRLEITDPLAKFGTAVSRFDYTLLNLQHQFAGLNFALGRTTEPSEIVLGYLDTYDCLDQGWQSFRDTAGKQLSPAAIVGERERTAVIVVLGQSNAANHGSGRYTAKHYVDNFNLYNGACYHAADPLLGTSGDEGNFATRLGDKLIEAGLFDRVILAPIAMGGTTIEQWAEEGIFNRRIVALISRLHVAGLTTDFILWHQGEGNAGNLDSRGRQYRKNLLEVVGTFRRYGVAAPFLVALATRCGETPHPNAENIRAGQLGAVNPMSGIYLGPDTDTIGLEHRSDKCHFSETGLDLAASLWLQSISDVRSAISGRADNIARTPAVQIGANSKIATPA